MSKCAVDLNPINKTNINQSWNFSNIFHETVPLSFRSELNFYYNFLHVTASQKELLKTIKPRISWLFDRDIVIYSARGVLINGYGAKIVNGTLYKYDI